MAASRYFDPLRHTPAFRPLVAQAEAGRQAALMVFREKDGERVLGVTFS